MWDLQVTFASVYFLNATHSQFLRALLPELLEFAEGVLVFGGDVNFAMDPFIRGLAWFISSPLLSPQAPEGGSAPPSLD